MVFVVSSSSFLETLAATIDVSLYQSFIDVSICVDTPRGSTLGGLKLVNQIKNIYDEPKLGEEHQWRSQAYWGGCPGSLEQHIDIMKVFYNFYDIMHVIYMIILQPTGFVIFLLRILIYEINLS